MSYISSPTGFREEDAFAPVHYPGRLPPSKRPPLAFDPPSDPSTRDSSPAKVSFAVQEDLLSPKSASSRRGSHQGYDNEARRGSVKNMAIDAMKDVKKAGHKVKDKTAEVSTSVKSATKDAGKWVANQSSKKAKAAMDQAKSHLSCTEKFTLYAADKISKLSKKGFTHVFMFLMIVIYTAIGAAAFMVIEGSHEKKLREEAREAGTLGRVDTNLQRDLLIKKLWEDTKGIQSLQDYEEIAEDMIHEYEVILHDSFKIGVGKHTEERDWTFWKAMFFCSTITTTIGYGNVTPQTELGQIITIVYALIGIPLFLILLADFGKLFTRLLKQMFILWAKVKKSSAYKRFRSQPHVQRVIGRLGLINDVLSCNCGESDPDRHKKSTNPEDYFSDGNFNIPVSLALGILGVYILLGSLLFTIWEKWDTFEAFYFIFISMTTIGFGDYVPIHPGFMMAATLYLVFGLSLTAMSINIIQEKLTSSFTRATMKIKDSLKHVKSSSHSEDDYDSVSGNYAYPVKNGPDITVESYS